MDDPYLKCVTGVEYPKVRQADVKYWTVSSANIRPRRKGGAIVSTCKIYKLDKIMSPE